LSQVRDTSKIRKNYSPTVNPISLFFFMLLAKAATFPKYSISAYVDQELSKKFIEGYPTLTTKLNLNGSFTFRRYLYDLQECPLPWNKVLHHKLNQMKFKRSIADPCAYIYTRYHKDGALYLTVHVDDMLLASSSDSARLWFEQNMESQFEISKQCNQLSYLGMTVKKSKDGISVHQRGYIDNMVSKFKPDPDSKTTSPTSTDFLIIEEKDENIEVTKYLGIVMSLMF